MATVSYRIKKDNEMNAVFCRFKQGKLFDYELSIGIKAPRGRWSDSKEVILSTTDVDYKKVNIKLAEFKIHLIKKYEDSKTDGVLISNKWFKETIKIFFNKETNNPKIDGVNYFVNFINVFIEESKIKKTRKGTPVKSRTIQHYNTTLNKIKAYEEFTYKKLLLSQINLDFHYNFITFLEKEQNLNYNTIGGYIDDIKLFCSNAQKKGLKVPNDYKLSEFYTTSNRTYDIYLTKIEIDKIFKMSFNQDYLDNARDWLIIGLMTGLRVSDLLKLNSEDVSDGFIQVTTIKTEFPVIIPINEEVEEILNKRNGEFPRKISDQNFNDYIKKVCKEAGLIELVEGAKMIPIETTKDGKKVIIHRKRLGIYPKYELVSSHICRRSFATNLYGEIDTLTIMKVTGHATEKQFLDYIKITPMEYAIRLREHWNKIKESKRLNS